MERGQRIIYSASKIITYYEVNQKSLRNAMKIYPKLIDDTDERIYSQVHALVFETVRHQNIINRFIHENFQKFLNHKLPTEFRNLIRVITYLLILDPNEDKKASWEAICENILNSIETPKLNQFLNIYKNKIQTWNFYDFLNTIKDPEERIGVQYSHPTWLVRDFKDFYGLDTTIKILKSNNEILPVYLRLNLINYSKDEIINRLSEENVVVEEDPDLFDVLKVISWKKPLPRLNTFSEGLYYVQNKGSSLISHIIDPQKDENILDACAAPGGKTTHISSLLKGTEGRIVALDNHMRRMEELITKITLFKLNNVFPILYDLRINSVFKITFDKILVDAPCSGSGTFASRPDSKWRIDRHHILWISKLQYKMLMNASKLLKEDSQSALVYSTCSLHPYENERVIRRFLDNNPNFELKPQKIFIGTQSPVFPLAQRLFPYKNQTEGFSIFKLGFKDFN